MTRAAARMRGEHVDALLDELSNLPEAITTPITAAWHAKQDLLDLLALARTHPNREDIRDLLHQFYQRCADAGPPELDRLATTAQTWWPEILAFLRTGITNAGSEGTNRVIKTIARDAYGLRNPISQRLRTRTATTRKARGHLDPRQLRRAGIRRRPGRELNRAGALLRKSRADRPGAGTRLKSGRPRPPSSDGGWRRALPALPRPELDGRASP